VSEMENDGVLFVLYNDGVIRQIMITEESDGSPIIYGRHCDYISETPGEWSEWDDTHTSTISDRSISSTTIDACEEYGIYPFLGSKSNIEAYNQSGLLITFWADWLQQAVIGDKGIYIRKKDGGSWSEWTQLGHTEIPPASIDVLGGIKPYAVGGINRSGLVIYEDGTAVVNTKTERGITRDGAGQIGINPATQDEVTAGTEAYKPVTPATLKAELERRGTDSGSSSISTEVVLPELPLTEFVENIAAVRIPVDFTPKPGMAVRVTENLWGGFDTILDVDNRTWLAASSFVNPGKSAIIMFGTSPTDEEPQSGVFYIINLD
ncbi:MAG: hypothetical protein J1G06_10535, partial [Oscillospiraceae bacterium]|nr:hypothetical protein [Oscillospiraceae bacterium]